MATKRGTLFFLVTLSALMALTSLSTDIYLPALPLMSRTLGGDAALLGALQYGSGIVSSLLLAVFADGTPRPMAWLIATAVVLSAAMVVRVKPR